MDIVLNVEFGVVAIFSDVCVGRVVAGEVYKFVQLIVHVNCVRFSRNLFSLILLLYRSSDKTIVDDKWFLQRLECQPYWVCTAYIAVTRFRHISSTNMKKQKECMLKNVQDKFVSVTQQIYRCDQCYADVPWVFSFEKKRKLQDITHTKDQETQIQDKMGF